MFGGQPSVATVSGARAEAPASTSPPPVRRSSAARALAIRSPSSPRTGALRWPARPARPARPAGQEKSQPPPGRSRPAWSRGRHRPQRRGAAAPCGSSRLWSSSSRARSSAWQRISGMAVVSSRLPRRSEPSVQSGAATWSAAGRSRPAAVVSKPPPTGARGTQAAREQVGDQRVVDPGQVGLRAGAVQHGTEPLPRSAVQPDLDAVRGAERLGHRPAADADQARVDGAAQGGGADRRDPVAVGLPEPQVPAEQSGLVGGGELLPQGDREGTKAVHARPPVAVLAPAGGDLPQHRPAQRVEARGGVDVGCRGDDQRCVGVRLGDQPVARQGVHDPAGAPQAERHVHHGQAGADEQHVAVLGNPLQRAGCPRVGQVAGRRAQLRRCPALARCEVAQGQHHGVEVEPLPAAEPQAQRCGGRVRLAGDADHAVVQADQVGGAVEPAGGVEAVGEVAAVPAPGMKSCSP